VVDQLAAAHDPRHRIPAAAVVAVEFDVVRDIVEFAADQAVASHDVMPLRQHRVGEMAAEKTGNTRDEDLHCALRRRPLDSQL
jgi:hypothetical protein